MLELMLSFASSSSIRTKSDHKVFQNLSGGFTIENSPRFYVLGYFLWMNSNLTVVSWFLFGWGDAHARHPNRHDLDSLQ